ncbi:Gm166 [Symbiodinium sp. CCMP2456]|nr:Gm166 [Symbiodinium sp. CCMP2456]
MLDRLTETYTHSVKYILSVSVRTVNFLKYMQRVALDYSVDSAYDQVMYQRQLMVKPPPAKPSFSAAMGRIFVEAVLSFTHSASASFNFFKGAYKGQALDYLAALIRLCEKVVGPIVKENSEFRGDLGGWIAQPNSPLFETQKEAGVEAADRRRVPQSAAEAKVAEVMDEVLKNHLGNLESRMALPT